MKCEVKESSLDEPVCPHCLRPVTGQHHFCPHCNAPLTSFATTGPYEQVLAQGYAVRAGVSRPTNRFVLIGMWLLFAPTLLISAGSIVGLWFVPQMMPDDTLVGRCVGMIVAAFWLVLSALILFKSTRNYLRRRSTQEESKDLIE